jgi:hypothetical protein
MKQALRDLDELVTARELAASGEGRKIRLAPV